MKYIFAVLLVCLLWTLWGYLSSRVEQAQYSVIKKTPDYEIRDYAAHIEAQATVQGSYDDALNEGFRIIAGYIFGGNIRKQSIAMTAPVCVGDQGDMHTVSFVMPGSYTLDSLPIPNDPRVKLVSVPERKVATLRFSWYRTSARTQAMKEKLLADLKKDGVQAAGDPLYAGYNAPWTPPWLIRNEILVVIK